jgi:hypothetical protein
MRLRDVEVKSFGFLYKTGAFASPVDELGWNLNFKPSRRSANGED